MEHSALDPQSRRVLQVHAPDLHYFPQSSTPLSYQQYLEQHSPKGHPFVAHVPFLRLPVRIRLLNNNYKLEEKACPFVHNKCNAYYLEYYKTEINI
ncbi:hypothetical protein I4U23_014976 [Adineta vaga]|nr:hypothetical protein I4U23_014976 [Adineta vaga]